MPLTVADALSQISVLSAAKVVAGTGGLQRVVRWAHVVDIPDASSWVRPGDLLLTTAFAFKDNLPLQLELVPGLVEKGVAGLLVAIGRYFHEIPQPIVSLADGLAFPIVTLPFEIPFVEVTEAIHRRICNEQYELAEKSLHIHRVLTGLVLEERGLGVVAESLANLLNRSVTIEDTSFRLLAYAVASPEDPIRQRTISEGKSPEEIIAYLTDQGLFDQIRKNPRPQRVAPIPELRMNMERIVAPILVGSHLYGYVWIISNGAPLEELDSQAIESAAVVVALVMSRQQAVYQAEQRLKDTLLNELFDPEPYRDIGAVTDTLHRMGLHHGYQVLVLEDLSGELVNRDRLCALIEDTIRPEGIKATVVDRGQRFIVLLGTADSCQGMEVAERLVQAATQNRYALLVGIGTPSREATNVRVCYQQSVEAMQIGKTQSDGQPGVWAFEELGFLHWLHGLSPNLQSSSRYYRIVSEMAAFDQKHNTALLKTLEVFLDHMGNSQQTARALYVHRNTLNRHLQKIEETWKVDLKNPRTLLNLMVSIKGWRLSQSA